MKRPEYFLCCSKLLCVAETYVKELKLIKILLSILQTLNEKLKPLDLRISNLESKYVANKLSFI